MGKHTDAIRGYVASNLHPTDEAISGHLDAIDAEQREMTETIGALMENKTCSPLKMTPDERKALWASFDRARAILAKVPS